MRIVWDVLPQGVSKPEPTVLALGVDGGFRTDEQKYDVVKAHRLVVLTAGGTQGFSVKYPDEVMWLLVVTSIIGTFSAPRMFW